MCTQSAAAETARFVISVLKGRQVHPRKQKSAATRALLFSVLVPRRFCLSLHQPMFPVESRERDFLPPPAGKRFGQKNPTGNGGTRPDTCRGSCSIHVTIPVTHHGRGACSVGKVSVKAACCELEMRQRWSH